jgi:hypothetical protein
VLCPNIKQRNKTWTIVNTSMLEWKSRVACMLSVIGNCALESNYLWYIVKQRNTISAVADSWRVCNLSITEWNSSKGSFTWGDQLEKLVKGSQYSKRRNRHRKHKKLKLGCGQTYDRSNGWTAVVEWATTTGKNLLYRAQIVRFMFIQE